MSIVYLRIYIINTGGDILDYVDRLTALRVDNDIEQKVIAELLSCKQSAVSKYETRRAKYNIDDVILLCKYYDVSADYIFGFTEEMKRLPRR